MATRLKSSGIAALSFTLSAGILALALAPSAVSAAPIGPYPDEFAAAGERIVESRRVDANDLDLTSASDLKTLDGRIRRAIAEVCRESGNPRATLDNSACRGEARRSADQQLAALRSSVSVLAAANGVSRARTITVVASR